MGLFDQAGSLNQTLALQQIGLTDDCPASFELNSTEYVTNITARMDSFRIKLLNITFASGSNIIKGQNSASYESLVWNYTEENQLVGFYGYKGQQALFAYGSLTYQKGCRPDKWVDFNHLSSQSDAWHEQILQKYMSIGIVVVVFVLFFVPVGLYVAVRAYRRN